MKRTVEQVVFKKRTPVKKRRAGKPRRGPWRSASYRAFVRMHPCVACQKQCVECGVTCQGRGLCVGVPVDAMHSENNGMASKGPDSSCIPGCRKHHREYDAGRKAFEQKYGINMKAEAEKLFSAWCSENRFDPASSA